jgi:hypothetical protein
MRRLKNNLPFLVGSLILVVGLYWIIADSVRENNGHLVYTLDDPYIHMSIAKNLATHGVFGVTRFEFSSSTSSPLWTLLLALSYRIIGVKDWLPGLFAAFFALATLYQTQSLTRLMGVRLWAQLLTVLLVAYFTPMIALVSTGMEHAMHAFFASSLLAATLSFTLHPTRRTLAWLCTNAFLAVAARYESGFLVAPLAVLLLCRKQWRPAVALTATAILPILAYGAVSLWNGSFLLPNSLMLKGHFPQIEGLKSFILAVGYYGFGRLTATNHLFVLSLLLLLGATRRHSDNLLPLVALAICASLLMHLQLASLGWFYRYEAYLVAISLPVITALYLRDLSLSAAAALARKRMLATLALLGCIVLVCGPLHRRAKESLENVARASNHIYRQQFHMGQFIKQEYAPGVSVALNDLGAVSYFADAKIVDLWGLGTIEVARAKRRGDYNTATIHQLVTTRQVDVVMVYTNWFKGDHALPDDLIHVADWTTTSNYFGKTVSFLALSQEKSAELGERLRRYEANLPPSVEVEYEITEQSPAGDVLKAAPEE